MSPIPAPTSRSADDCSGSRLNSVKRVSSSNLRPRC
jgi:hypothetical protein